MQKILSSQQLGRNCFTRPISTLTRAACLRAVCHRRVGPSRGGTYVWGLDVRNLFSLPYPLFCWGMPNSAAAQTVPREIAGESSAVIIYWWLARILLELSTSCIYIRAPQPSLSSQLVNHRHMRGPVRAHQRGERSECEDRCSVLFLGEQRCAWGSDVTRWSLCSAKSGGASGPFFPVLRSPGPCARMAECRACWGNHGRRRKLLGSCKRWWWRGVPGEWPWCLIRLRRMSSASSRAKREWLVSMQFFAKADASTLDRCSSRAALLAPMLLVRHPSRVHVGSRTLLRSPTIGDMDPTTEHVLRQWRPPRWSLMPPYLMSIGGRCGLDRWLVFGWLGLVGIPLRPGAIWDVNLPSGGRQTSHDSLNECRWIEIRCFWLPTD
jgi:hypothetical protein